jgi:hypothetical protein
VSEKADFDGYEEVEPAEPRLQVVDRCSHGLGVARLLGFFDPGSGSPIGLEDHAVTAQPVAANCCSPYIMGRGESLLFERTHSDIYN